MAVNLLTKTTFIQRLNTNGGSAPATGCVVPGDVASRRWVPYTADTFSSARRSSISRRPARQNVKDRTLESKGAVPSFNQTAIIKTN